MRKILLTLIDILAWPLGILQTSSIYESAIRLHHIFYAAILRRKFHFAPRLYVTGTPIYVCGGKHIEIGENTVIGFGTRLEAIEHYGQHQNFHPQLNIGSSVFIGPLSHIGCIDHVEIGDYTTLGERTYITDHEHGTIAKEMSHIPPMERPLVSRGAVHIGKNVILGENSVVMAGVTIGDYCHIGANAVVTHDLPPYSVAVGCPARIIKTLSPLKP